jgi:hypothetical protein
MWERLLAWLTLKFVAIAGLANRPKNIRIHLTVSRVRFYLLCFNSSGNFCDGGAICSRGTPLRDQPEVPDVPFDVVMNEDQDRTRLGNGPHNLAVLRHMALNAMQKEGSKGSSELDPNLRKILDQYRPHDNLSETDQVAA